MEPMRISCTEVIEIFGDSDSENGDDFAGLSPDAAMTSMYTVTMKLNDE